MVVGGESPTTMSGRPLQGVDGAMHPAERHAYSLPPQKEDIPIQEAAKELPTPTDTHKGTPSPVPSSPLSYLSRTPSSSPPRNTPAENLTGSPAAPSKALKAPAGKPETAKKRQSPHFSSADRREQVRLAELKAELARVYRTEDRSRSRATPTPASLSSLPPLAPSLAAGPFVRYMARVYTTDIEDVQIQKYLRETVMTTAHFNELMIWHRRALKERSRNPKAVQWSNPSSNHA